MGKLINDYKLTDCDGYELHYNPILDGKVNQSFFRGELVKVIDSDRFAIIVGSSSDLLGSDHCDTFVIGILNPDKTEIVQFSAWLSTLQLSKIRPFNRDIGEILIQKAKGTVKWK